MTDVIKLLPDSVANQIAAGEVVQRPASVVKELLENAVDAGSTSVTVNIREGGRELIQVVDNGCGMSPQDALLAFERHATSKIARADDLYALSTFGFRGEALPSIASVSEVELRSRRAEDEVGTRVTLTGGKLEDRSAANVPYGTQMLVKNLFYNIPARRKFLKSNSVETKHIIAEFQRMSLCNPQVEMKLCNNDTCLYNLPSSNRRQRIVNLMGKHINASLLELSVNTSIISIEGFVGSPQSAKKSGSEQFLFVNNRYFRSPYFHKAVMLAYEKLIQSDVQPSYFLYMTVDPSRIDVNIHPSKTEIKFEDEQAVWQIVNAAVRESLGKFGAVPMLDFDNEAPIDIPVYREEGPVKEPVSSLNPEFNPFETGSEGVNPFPAGGRKPHSGSRGGGLLRHMTYSTDGVPEGWEALYKDDYDSFDKTTAKGDTFRDFISEVSADEEAEEFVLGGFDAREDGGTGEAFSEIESACEGGEEQAALEIESGMGEPLAFLRISDRYAAVSEGGKLLVIDLCRAHRRILYERFLRQDGPAFSVNQQELFPEPVAVSPADLHLLTEAGEDLLRMGFDLQREGEGSVVLKGIPTDLEAVPAPKIVDSLLHDLKAEGKATAAGRRERLAAALARSCALNRPRAAFDEEIRGIAGSLLACDEPAYTPDGRPTMLVLTPEEIMKKLKPR